MSSELLDIYNHLMSKIKALEKVVIDAGLVTEIEFNDLRNDERHQLEDLQKFVEERRKCASST